MNQKIFCFNECIEFIKFFQQIVFLLYNELDNDITRMKNID